MVGKTLSDKKTQASLKKVEKGDKHLRCRRKERNYRNAQKLFIFLNRNYRNARNYS